MECLATKLRRRLLASFLSKGVVSILTYQWGLFCLINQVVIQNDILREELEQNWSKIGVKNWSKIDATFHGIVADRSNNNAMKLPSFIQCKTIPHWLYNRSNYEEERNRSY